MPVNLHDLKNLLSHMQMIPVINEYQLMFLNFSVVWEAQQYNVRRHTSESNNACTRKREHKTKSHI